MKVCTVVCILVWMKSSPRFWRNHPYCRNKWYLIWTGCLFSLRWSKKNQNGRLMHFLPVFELMLDSLTTIEVEPNQCPSHQLILLTQGPIHEFFMKKYWELEELENEFFLSWPFWIIFFQKNFSLLHLNENKQPFHMWYHLFLHYGWFLQNLGKDFIRTNMHTTVNPLPKNSFGWRAPHKLTSFWSL